MIGGITVVEQIYAPFPPSWTLLQMSLCMKKKCALVSAYTEFF